MYKRLLKNTLSSKMNFFNKVFIIQGVHKPTRSKAAQL